MDATAFTTCLGIWVLISPANSTKRLGARPAGRPREIPRVNGDAVPPETWSRIKARESKRLGGRGIHHFVDINAHPFQDHLVLVDHAILTARYVFSRSLAASATSAEPTGTTSSHTSAYNATAAPEAGSRPPTKRGMDRMGVARPGSSRSGAKAKKKSLPNVRPPEDNSGRQTSRVVQARWCFPRPPDNPAHAHAESSRKFAARTSGWAAGLHQLGSAHTPKSRRMMPTRSHHTWVGTGLRTPIGQTDPDPSGQV